MSTTPITDDQLAFLLNTLNSEVQQLRAQVAAAYAFADEMGDYCSPHGIAVEYARRLRERLDQAQPDRATDRARHDN